MYWELWEIRSANLVDTFDTEEQALQGVRDLLAVNRRDLADDLTLGAMYDEGEPKNVPLPPALTGDELRARLAETAPVHAADDATRAVHEKIRRWLTEEGWSVEVVQVLPATFNIVALQNDGRAISVFQDVDHLDHVTLSLRWSRDHAQTISGHLPPSEFDDVVWNVYRDVSAMGVEFHGVDAASPAMMLRDFLYFDGLTKDALMHRINLVNRAYTLAMRTFVRALQASGNSPDRALSPEELRRIVRPMPQTDGPLSIAG
jgi:hypothetical protein